MRDMSNVTPEGLAVARRARLGAPKADEPVRIFLSIQTALPDRAYPDPERCRAAGTGCRLNPYKGLCKPIPQDRFSQLLRTLIPSARPTRECSTRIPRPIARIRYALMARPRTCAWHARACHSTDRICPHPESRGEGKGAETTLTTTTS